MILFFSDILLEYLTRKIFKQEFTTCPHTSRSPYLGRYWPNQLSCSGQRWVAIHRKPQILSILLRKYLSSLSVLGSSSYFFTSSHGFNSILNFCLCHKDNSVSYLPVQFHLLPLFSRLYRIWIAFSLFLFILPRKRFFPLLT